MPLTRYLAQLAALALILAGSAAFAHDKPEASNMRLVGFSDLQARSAYQPVVRQQGGRWIAYIGHHGGIPEAEKPVNPLTGRGECNSTSLLDITDPARPNNIAITPVASVSNDALGAQMHRACER